MGATLNFPLSQAIRALNAGCFISRGQGTHPTRVMDSHELILVDQGRLQMFVGESAYDLQPGETLLLPAGLRHGGSAPYQSDTSFYWIHFSPREKSDTRQEQRHAVPLTTRLLHPERLTGLFRRFLDDQERGLLDPLNADLLVALMLSEIVRAKQTTPPDGRGAHLADRARRFITTHAGEPISTLDVAQAVRANPDYLGRVYRRTYGGTITQAIHDCRLRDARRLLMDSLLSIDEIARRCGQGDAAHFRRIFRRSEGMSPSAYRKLYARVHANTE